MSHEEEARAIVHAWLRGAPCGFQLMARPDNMLPLVEAVATALRASERRGLKRADEICLKVGQDFLSDDYSTGQPLSSFSERFACTTCAAAIRAEKEKL